jgi:predicted permease
MLARFWSLFSALTRRQRFEDTLSEELQFHLGAYAGDLIAKGMSRKEAYRQARVHFGSVERVRDECRQARGLRLIDDLIRDARYGGRRLAKTPGFTVLAVLSLAIGIGANTAMFSLVNAIIMREVPLDRLEDLVNVYESGANYSFGQLSYPNFEDLRDATEDVFDGVSLSRFSLMEIERGGEFETALGEAVAGSYFSLRSLSPTAGRLFTAEDNVAPGAHPVMVLSHAYWQSAFAADPAVVGQVLRLAGRAYTVVGVAPPEYRGNLRGLEPALYAPYMMINELLPSTDDELRTRSSHSLYVTARLRPGVSLADAERAVGSVAARLRDERVDGWNPQRGFTLVPSSNVLFSPELDPILRAVAWLLMVVVGLVLVLACTNLASFLLARALDRRREVAVRLALGASRSALVRQLLTESMLLGLLGGGVGLWLAVSLLQILQNADLPLLLPLTLDIDGNVLAFTLGISMLTGTLIGLVPALQGTRPDVAPMLKSGTTGGGHPGQLRWRNALVVTQLTASLVLLVGTGLFLRSVQHMEAVDPGFGRDPAALMTVVASQARSAADNRQYARRLLDRMRILPSVDVVGLIDNLPLNTISTQSLLFNVDGHEPPQDRAGFEADHATVDSGFFHATGIPIVRGRSFTDAEQPAGPQVAIISEVMARRFWPDGDAVGRVVRRPRDDDADLLVVGVAADINVRSLGEAPRFMVYLPYGQVDAVRFNIVARTVASPEQTALALLAAAREVDPDLRVLATNTMAGHLALGRLPTQALAFVLSVFGGLALLLAAIGLYGVVSYHVATRIREVGIRIALGADASAVVRLLASGALRLVVVGGAIGLALSLLVTRLLGGLLFGIGTVDPVTFAAAPLVLGATAILAAYLPARRASRIDPVVALRTD